jgi:glucose uptake protein
MILPATPLASLLLLILAFVCLGSWANTQKLVYKWQFELFYYDFAVGVALSVLVAVYFLGSANPQELTASDNMVIVSYHRVAYAGAAGMVGNLANILMVAAISISGISVAVPISAGVGLIVMSLTNYIGNPPAENALILFAGLLLILGAVVANILAYRAHVDALAKAAKRGPVLDPHTRLPVRNPKAKIGIILSLISGVAWGFFFPLIDSSRYGENGFGPYGVAGMIATAVFFSTLLYVPFFINFPIHGDAMKPQSYFKGMKKQHAWGIFGGIVWATGLLAALTAASGPPNVQPGPALTSILLFGAPILLTIWGLFAWGEFKAAGTNVRMLLVGTVFSLTAGLVLVSIAPVFAAK